MTNVLLLYDELIPSVRLCAYEQLNYLDKERKLNFYHSTFKKLTEEICKNSDVVVMVRCETLSAGLIAKRCIKRNKFLIYIMDDDLLNLPQDYMVATYLSSDAVKKRILNMISTCDLFLSTSEKIITKYKNMTQKTHLIEEPVVNTSICYNRIKNDKIIIGFAGSVDKGSDFETFLPNVIKRLLNKYGDIIEIQFMGAKPKFVEELELQYYPYVDDYEQYQKMMCDLNWDIGLAPMPDTEFHSCKHYNKYIEYSTYRIAGVYSNVLPYIKVINDGENGMLCDNTIEDWIEKISILIEQKWTLEKIQDTAYNDVKKNYSCEVVSNKYLNVVPELLFYKANDKRKIGLKNLNKTLFGKRAIEFIYRYKFYFMIVLVKKCIVRINEKKRSNMKKDK